MELTFDKSDAKFQITGLKPGSVFINKQEYRHSLIVMSDKLITDSVPNSVDDLDSAYFQSLLEYNPQVILLGTGNEIRFPNPAIFEPLYKNQVGIEVMDTKAACRTYTVLASEERKVLAILILE